MKIVIDLQGAQTESRFRGIGRYSLSLAKAIAKNAGEHEVWLILNGALKQSVLDLRSEFQSLIPQDRIRVFNILAPVAEHDPSHSSKARVAELMREYFLEQLNPDIVLLTSLFEGYADDAVTSVGKFTKSYKTAVILYDLIPYLNQKEYLSSKIRKAYYSGKINSLQQADILLAISEASRQECKNAFHMADEKIVTISTAVDGTFEPRKLSSKEKQTLFEKHNISREIVMCAPGGFDIRKNLKNLIMAYAQLPQNLRDTHHLVIMSKIHENDRHMLEDVAKKVGLNKEEFIITGYVSDEELIAFYATCKLFVFPSLHEGFGLPLLEAMACGAAVIGSNTTSIPEVIGLQKALFNPNSVEAIAKKMQEVLEDEALLQELQTHALQQCKNFSWDESAKKAIKAMTTVSSLQSEQTHSFDDLIKAIVGFKAFEAFTDDELIKLATALSQNLEPDPKQKQLFVDISQLIKIDAKSGIQRVTRSILFHWLQLKDEHVQIKPIYFDGKVFRHANQFVKESFGQERDVEDHPIDYTRQDTYVALDLNAHLTKRIEPFLENFKSLGMNIAFIVYDILPLQNPQWWPQGTSKVFESWLRVAISYADTLVCISQSVADELKDWISNNVKSDTAMPKIASFHLGADIKSSLPSKGLPENAKKVLKILSSSPTFLAVGTLEPRKGYEQLLYAFEELWQEGHEANLAIVGKKGWMVEDLCKKIAVHPKLNRKLFWFDAISDEYLESIYKASSCLIAPSEAEGFGLPLIEAAQKSLPIIARDIPVFREVAQEHALYFENSMQPSSIKKAVLQWLALEGKHPSSTSMPYLTWEESAKQLITILKK